MLVHLKVLRLFVESVLRYGLPANYVGLVIKVSPLILLAQTFCDVKPANATCLDVQPEPKTQKKVLTTLNSHFSYLAPRSNSKRAKAKGGTSGEEFLGEYQTILEQEFLDFVIFDVPWIVD